MSLLDIYKSSAGSGKTYTLVKSYLSLALRQPSSYRNILAITFTNKAAGEMKQRIVKALRHLSMIDHYPDSVYCRYMLPDLIKQTGLEQETISLNAARALTLILHDYTNFAVSTIDSFTHRIIRAFSFDLRLPGNFEVETDTGGALERVIGQLIDKAGLDEGLTDLLTGFIQFRTDSDKSWQIENDIADVAAILFREDSSIRLETISHLRPADFQVYIGKLNRMVISFENRLAQTAQKAVDIIEAAGVDAGSFYYGNTGIGRYFYRIAGRDFSSLPPKARVQKTVEDDCWYSDKLNQGMKARIDGIKPELTDIYNVLQHEKRENYPEYLTCLLVKKTIYPVALLNEIWRLIKEYKTDNNILFISEFNALISGVIAGEPTPFVYERAGQKFRHIMIDEFQDTSVLQWENMLPLIENSLSEGGSGMLVGDPKQAIYRWRNGEVDQFIRLTSESKEESPAGEEYIRPFIKQTHLDKNYRSRRAIVDFNNSFFTSLAGLLEEEYQTVYSDCTQEWGSGKPGGFVRIKFLLKEKNGGSEPDPPEETLSAVRECLKLGYSYKDIAILCRTNSNGLKIAASLLGEDIPVISSESLLLNSSPAVRILVSMFRYYIHPGDKPAALEAAYFLFHSGIIHRTPWDFLDFLMGEGLGNGDGNRYPFVQWLNMQGLSPLFPVPAGITLYDLAESLVRDFGLARTPDPFIQFFLDEIMDFMEKNSSGIASFIEWWSRQGEKKSIVIPEKVDAVKVMTIHKAKGLEFPVVIYPFADEMLRLTHKQNWSDVKIKDMEGFNSTLLSFEKAMTDTNYGDEYLREKNKSLLDMLNLLYVCMTRPTDRLYVFTGGIPESIDEVNSLPLLFHHYLSEKGLWEEGRQVYDFGDPDCGPGMEGGVSAAGEPFLWISLPWQNRLTLSLRAPGNWDDALQMDSQGWGTLVHEVLSQVMTPPDVQQVVDKYHLRGLISSGEKEVLIAMLENFFLKPGISRFFSPGLKVLREAEMIDEEGRSSRPDRLVFFEDETAVVDFKTGRRLEVHEYQVKQYARLLERMGYQKIRMYLLYVNDENPLHEAL
ncbi:MAG: UvrD-helicase domain-containing protein [Bacteroidales bacterium]|nr:UvrD-helicase domain-containing protein [Bacteroidales bacterium]